MKKSGRIEIRIEQEYKNEFYNLCSDPSGELRQHIINYIKKNIQDKKNPTPPLLFSTWEDIEKSICKKNYPKEFITWFKNAVDTNIRKRIINTYANVKEKDIDAGYSVWIEKYTNK